MEALGTALYLLAASAMAIGLVVSLFNLLRALHKMPLVNCYLGLVLFFGGILVMVLVPSKAHAQTNCPCDSYFGNGICACGSDVVTPKAITQPALASISYHTGSNMVIAQTIGRNSYAITVYTNDGKYKLTEFTNGCPRVEAIGDNCWELPQTTDFVGIGGLPQDAGPFVPMVLCLIDSGMEAGLVDSTGSKDIHHLKDRLYQLDKDITSCRAISSCMNDNDLKAKVIEAMIIRDILMKEAPWHWKPSSWYGLEDFTFNGLENEITRILILRSWETHRLK